MGRRSADGDEDAGRSWPWWVLLAVGLALAALFIPPLTRTTTARELCLAAAPKDITVAWSLAPLPLPHWQCAIQRDSGDQIIDLGWWPVSR